VKAYAVKQNDLQVREVKDPSPNAEEVVIDIKVAGLNRRDLSIAKKAGDREDPLVLGSDAAGVISAVGENVQGVQVGDEVIINPSLRWKQNSDAPPEGFDILGFPDNGTLAEKIVLHHDQVEPKPRNISWEESGVLALASLTGYRALVTKGEVKAGQTVFIPGAGSGVATYMIQIAKSKGAKVIVSSRSESKREAALKIGADVAIDTNSDWEKELADETIDLIIDSVGAATFNRSLDVLKKGGKMVIFGATTDDVTDLDLRAFFYGQYQLLGSTMGSREELHEVLKLIEDDQIKPVVSETYSLDKADEAFEYLKVNDQFGNIAIKVND